MEKTHEQMDIEFYALLRRLGEKGLEIPVIERELSTGYTVDITSEGILVDIKKGLRLKSSLLFLTLLTIVAQGELGQTEKELTINDLNYIRDVISAEYLDEEPENIPPDNLINANKVLNQFKLYLIAYS